ncbi:putative N(4)-(beta-N-acetylglucosaminyl)-L-asparaginase [Pseudolycoriella hygida]|uniref:N(4)-(beta-N-acetylglucosaminyl)-L-asparaginase n=1 Tax=Pseudolycoriella hygida TaxID=35572 RepID=A0A9Q0N6B1_9DIPT|nr:putative N(4)-(beta-N-acetylglucosaminyl)-L-asparaginase [Pseudolycoriella hygida]
MTEYQPTAQFQAQLVPYGPAQKSGEFDNMDQVSSTKIIFVFIITFQTQVIFASLPLVINTWNFRSSTIKAWETVFTNKQSAVDAVVEGCSVCEREQCDTTVGYGGSPDENGETTLDAMIMDGATMNIGAVAALRNVKDAIAVARNVLQNTKHTMLVGYQPIMLDPCAVGSQATEFAIQMGYTNESLRTNYSQGIWQTWKDNSCQPNFWVNVQPNSSTTCGPYEPISNNDVNNFWTRKEHKFGSGHHDTIGMIVIDSNKNVAAGTSTNGARHKIPGRVGDSPIPGSGAYCDNTVGAASATGDGDVMMRFLPALLAVEFLRANMTPSNAGEAALRRIVPHYPDFVGAVIVANITGDYGAACHGMLEFPFSVYTELTGNRVERVKCFSVN